MIKIETHHIFCHHNLLNYDIMTIMTVNELNEMRKLSHQISIIADQCIGYTYNDMRVTNLSAKMYYKVLVSIRDQPLQSHFR